MSRLAGDRWLGGVGLLAVVGLVAGCGGSSDATGGPSSPSSGSGTQLALVAYSTPKPAYDALTGAFEQTPDGKGISFTTSFGASGAQRSAVDAGQPANGDVCTAK